MPTHTQQLITLVLLAVLLSGCERQPTYAEAQATAIVAGCWPDGYATPRPATLTPVASAVIGLTATALLSTTPYPRCPPRPGATAVLWPTAMPAQAPYPTIEPRRWVGGSAPQTTLHLPEKVLTLDLATHPTAGWPAVISAVWSGDLSPDRVMVSVLNPEVNQWSHARQVDLGPSRIGRYVRSVAIGITGAGEVVAVWGMSDPDFQDNDPPSGIWTVSSRDYGETWSPPERIASDCRMVNDLVAAPDGVIVVQLVCDQSPTVAVPMMVVRSAEGVWQPPEPIAAPIWKYSEGAIVLSGARDLATARLVSVIFAGSSIPTAYLISRSLAGGAWQVAAQPITFLNSADIGLRMGRVRGLAYDRVHPDGSIDHAVTFLWTGMDAPSGVFALTSLDGGLTWGAPERVIDFGVSGAQARFAALAYDPAADRLVALFTCCADASWDWVETTHAARWSVPGSGVWQTSGGEDAAQIVPLALGSRAAADTISAQAPGSRMAWLAWVETIQRVEVCSIDLNQIIPVREYPTLTVPVTSVGGA